MFPLKKILYRLHPHIWEYYIVQKIMFNSSNKKVKIPFIRKKCKICNIKREICIFMVKTSNIKKIKEWI